MFPNSFWKVKHFLPCLLFLCYLLSPSAFAGSAYNPDTGKRDLCVTVEETDGSPSNQGCGLISVSNGTLTDDGDGTFTLTTGGGASSNSFETISVPAGTAPVADSATDTLTITETTFLTITGTAGTDTIDITQVTTDIGTDGLIAANAVALATDTTGNYVSNVADGSGIDVTGTAGEDWTATVNLLYTDTLAGNPAMNADECRFSTDGTGGGIICEGAADLIEGLLVWNPTTSDRTLTLPDVTSTVAVYADNLSVFSATTSAQLAGVISDEQGSGALVFATSPVLTTATTATSFAIPQGTAPTVDAAGEIAQDTTDDQLLYGATPRVIPYERAVCFVIEDLAATDDNYAFYMANDAITVTSVGCNCRGTCTTTATFTLEDRGGTAMTITGTNPTCATTGAATFASVTAGGGLTAGEMVAFDVTNTPTASDEYALCVTYTVDRQ